MIQILFLPVPDPGSRGQKGTGSRIRIHNTGTNQEYTGKKQTDLLVLQLTVFFFPLRALRERFGLGGGEGDDIS